MKKVIKKPTTQKSNSSLQSHELNPNLSLQNVHDTSPQKPPITSYDDSFSVPKEAIDYKTIQVTKVSHELPQASFPAFSNSKPGVVQVNYPSKSSETILNPENVSSSNYSAENYNMPPSQLISSLPLNYNYPPKINQPSFIPHNSAPSTNAPLPNLKNYDYPAPNTSIYSQNLSQPLNLSNPGSFTSIPSQNTSHIPPPIYPPQEFNSYSTVPSQNTSHIPPPIYPTQKFNSDTTSGILTQPRNLDYSDPAENSYPYENQPLNCQEHPQEIPHNESQPSNYLELVQEAPYDNQLSSISRNYDPNFENIVRSEADFNNDYKVSNII